MIEASADNILQQDFLKAIKIGVKETQHIVHSIKQLQQSHGKPKREIQKPHIPATEMIEAAKS